MSQLATLWSTTQKIPFVGKTVFSKAFALKAPYFGSFHPLVTELRPNFASVVVPNRRSNHNHIKTVHAIAVCNGFEMAMGALAEATIPAHLRWIPKGMELEYLALADSTITATADTDPADWTGPGEVAVRVEAIRGDGTVVVRGVIRLHVSERRPG